MTPDHLTIGSFAALTGLTPSALRFYDDAGVLAPADVDASSGYRYYLPTQVPAAQLIRQLRETGMPLGDIKSILADDDPASTTRRIDEHLAELTRRLADATSAAAQVKSTIGCPTASTVGATIAGPLFAAACDQVLPATVSNPGLPVLDSVLVEVGDVLTLTATDRYRLASRSLRLDAAASSWSAAVPSGAIRSLAEWSRRQHRITLSTNGSEVTVSSGGDSRRFATLGETFPDYRLMLRALPSAVTRVVVSRAALLDVLERGERIVELSADSDAVSLGGTRLPATVTGPPVTLGFDVTVLHPTISTALGDDVLLDIAAEDQPVRVRSADDGDLVTLAMPVRV